MAGGQMLSEIGVAFFADFTGMQKAAQDMDKINQNIGNSAEKAAGTMSASFESATKSTRDLLQSAESAGLNVSKLASLQAKAGEAAARLEVAQAQAAAALARANEMETSGTASAEKIAVAQAQAALAAEKVNVAEVNAGNAMQKATDEANRLASAMESDSSKINLFKGGLEAAKSGLSSLVPNVGGAITGVWDLANKAGQAVFNLSNLAQGALSLGQTLLGPAATSEQTSKAFESLMGSADKAKQEISALESFSDQTIFNTQNIDDAALKMIGVGFAANDVIPNIKSIGDALAGVGKATPQYLDSMVSAFDKIKSSGHLSGEVMQSLSDIGVPATKALAVGLGISEDAARKLDVTSIGADKAILALSTGMEKMFPDAQAKQAQTFNGLLSTLESKANKALAALAGPALKLAEQGMTAIGNALSSKGFQDFAASVGQKIADTLQSIGLFVNANVVPALQKLAPIVQDIGQWFVLSFQHAQPLIEQVGNVLGGVFNGIISFVSSDQFSNLITDFESLGNQILRLDLSSLQNIGSILNPALNDIGSILTNTVVPILDTFINDLSQMYAWFNDNSISAQAVKDLMIGIGVAIATIKLGQFISTIPQLFASFQLWAAGAWEAAAGTIAATWPLLAIGALIALVVAGIILAVQHWGEISSWLQGVWAAFSSWFMSALGAIGGFFTGLWSGITTGLQAAWSFIVSIVQAGAQLLLAIIMGPFIAIGQAFVWLYNHNYYFQALVDSIVNIVKAGLAWVQGAWTAAVNWLVGLWNGIVAYATVLWDNISMQIKIGFQRAIIFVQGVWNTISSFFSNAWNTYIAGPLRALWSTVSNFFSGIWSNYIAGPIGSLWNQLTNTIGGWAGKAVDWGKNLIQSFVNGIVSMANSVAGAVGGIAGKVLAFLGFHSPTKEGPGREADKWAPAFVNMFAAGVEAGIPRIEKALGNFTKPLAFTIKASTNATPMSATPISATPVSVSSPASSGGNQTIEIHPHIYLGDREITDIVMERAVHELVHQLGVR